MRGMLDRSIVGRVSEPITLEVEPGHIRRFVEALGDANPLYSDPAAARAAGLPALPAPPTFAAALRARDVREGLGIDLRKLLHGEQEYEYRRPLYAGDRLVLRERIVDVQDKQGRSGAMQLLTLETTAHDPASGELVFVGRKTVVIRS